MPDSVFPFAIVLGLVLVAVVFALLVTLSVEQLALVPAAICPLVDTTACDGIVNKRPLVFKPARPHEFTLAMHESVEEFAFVGVAIAELDLAIAFETLEVAIGRGLDLDIAVPLEVVFGCELKR